MKIKILQQWFVPDENGMGDTPFITVQHNAPEEHEKRLHDRGWIEIRVHDHTFDDLGWSEYAKDIVEATMFMCYQQERLELGAELEIVEQATAEADD